MTFDAFHPLLKNVFDCNALNYASCSCKDLLFEQIVFYIQTSESFRKLIKLTRIYKPKQSQNTSIVYQVLDEQSPELLDSLKSFLLLLQKLNSELIKYLDVLLEHSDTFILNCEVFHEFQYVATSALCSFDLESLLCPLLQMYLSLELEHIESSSKSNNCFTSVIPINDSPEKDTLIEIAKTLIQSKQPINWFSLYKVLFIPYIEQSLIYRTKLLCSENFSDRFLGSIIMYKNCIIKKLLTSKLFPRKNDLIEINAQLSDEIIYSIFYSVHKPELFSLVIEYPDSVPALMDLSMCLEHLSVRQDLINHLTTEVQHRLIHPGVHTEQILVAYGYLVRALRLIDNTFLVQDIVCKPVSTCLRQREDAVCCIVDKLISAPDSDGTDDEVKIEEYIDSTTELHQELLLPKPLEVEPMDGAEDSDAEIVIEDPPYDSDTVLPGIHSNSKNQVVWGSDWKPDPIEALSQHGLWRRRLDLLSMLVSIYGSKKAFLVEYKQLLSQRLLKQRNFHTAREVRNLELLKLRFGEQNLHDCEVMLKDIRDSKRIAALVSEASSETINKSNPQQSTSPDDNNNNDNNNKLCQDIECNTDTDEGSKEINHLDPKSVEDPYMFPLSAYVLSIHYWPQLLDDKFKLPDIFRPVFNHYERCFQRLKGNRTLNWMHKLGLVNIDLKLGNHKVKLDVTPLQASIAYLFTKRRTWCLPYLAQQLEAQVSTVRLSLHLFIQVGFIRACESKHKSRTPGENNVKVNESNLEYYEVSDIQDVQSNPTESESTAEQNDCSMNATNDLVYPSQIETFDADSLVTNIRDQKEKELQMYWSYIVAMLTNLGSLSLDRIHSMLRMFALGSTSSVDFSRDQLHRFLDSKIKDMKLYYDGNMYRLSADN